jgi:hypothetical protein
MRCCRTKAPSTIECEATGFEQIVRERMEGGFQMTVTVRSAAKEWRPSATAAKEGPNQLIALRKRFSRDTRMVEGSARPLPVPSYNFFLGPNNNMKEKT